MENKEKSQSFDKKTTGIFFCSRILPEQYTQSFLDLLYWNNLDVELVSVESLQIVLRNDNLFESEFCGFSDALLNASHRADFPAFRIGKKILINRQALAEWIERESGRGAV